MHWTYYLTTLLGVRSTLQMSSWLVAGTMTYYLNIKPEQEAREQRRLERARQKELDIKNGTLDVVRVKPMPDPQDTGLLVNGKPYRRGATLAAHGARGAAVRRGGGSVGKLSQQQQEQQQQQQQQQQRREQQDEGGGSAAAGGQQQLATEVPQHGLQPHSQPQQQQQQQLV